MNNFSETPTISIVTVCLNSKETIGRAVESVLAQTYPEIEYIVIDGQSDDGTMDILNGYREEFKLRGISFSIQSDKDDGIYDAMNKGIMNCSGSIIGILNSDDYYEKTALASIAEAATKNYKADIFYGFIRMLYEDKELVVQRYNFDCFLLDPKTGVQSAAQHPTCFVRKRLYQRIGLFDTSFRTAADYDFLLRAARNSVSFHAVDKVITSFSSGGISAQISNADRLEQRYRAQMKNGLISEAEYKKYSRKLKPSLLRKLLRSIAFTLSN